MANENNLVINQKELTDTLNQNISRLQDEGLVIPQNYNYSNALKSAFFTLQGVKSGKDDGYQLALDCCTKESLANSLLDMVTQGLSPAKNQCYFVIYKDYKKGTSELQLQRSYFGTQAVLKRLKNVKDIWANVIYEGDEFDYEIIKGREQLLKHRTSFTHRDNEIIGAYAIIENKEGEQFLTSMTRKEINVAWGQGKTDNVQKKFPQEMAKRTVINRAAKAFINTSDDSDLLIEAINNTTENEYENERKIVDAVEEVKENIEANANQELVDIQAPIPKNEVLEAENEVDEEPKQESLFDGPTTNAKEYVKSERGF